MTSHKKTSRLRPEECSARAAQIAVDMAVMNVQYLNTLSQFIGKGELFHLQMNLLYCIIDIMGATTNMDPQTVIDVAGAYFESIRRERIKIEREDETD